MNVSRIDWPVVLGVGLLACWGCGKSAPVLPPPEIRHRAEAKTEPKKPAVQQTAKSEPEEAEEAGPGSAIIRNMPTNSRERCLGISVVAEALLDGERIDEDGCNDPKKLAGQIYGNLTTGHRIRYHPNVLIDNKRTPIDSKKALDKLSTLVADLYKQDYFRLLETPEGQQRLLTAQTRFLATSGELDRILDADPDKTALFCASGRRWFPDGTAKDTHHAVLIGKRPTGEKFVYDPNDPGSPIACDLRDNEDGLAISWTCRYKDTGLITTQQYRIIPKDTFFRLALGEGEGEEKEPTEPAEEAQGRPAAGRDGP